MILLVASLFTTSLQGCMKNLICGWLLVLILSTECVTQLKMPGIIKADFWTCFRKKTTGMRVSVTGVWNVTLVNVQFCG